MKKLIACVFVLCFSSGLYSSDKFVFPLANKDSVESYAKKISIKRNKFKALRRLDRYRLQNKEFRKLVLEKPHHKVISSILSVEAPQISTREITKDEVAPFYSNFFNEKYIENIIEDDWRDRTYQRLYQFRHQNEIGRSQIGTY